MANSENIPPTTTTNNKKARGGIQGASRRRRARSSGSPHHPRYAVRHAKPKATKQRASHISLPLSPSTDAAVPVAPISLPRYLCRPSFCQIAEETITSVAPELADTDLGYIRQGLRYLGPRMLQVLAGVKAEPPSNALPLKLDVVVNDVSSDMPTHMLAVYTRQVPGCTRRRVTLFPIHNIILATHCSNLPRFPPPNVTRPETPGSTISLPMVPLCLPAPDAFPHLSMFLYTKRIDHLLVSLLPCSVPHALYRDDPKSEAVLTLLQQFSSKLAAGHSTQTLLTHAMLVNGLWRNVCALGIDDAQLWCALDVAWEVLINALTVSTCRRP